MGFLNRIFGKKQKELDDKECAEVMMLFIKIQNLYGKSAKLLQEVSETTGISPEKLIDCGFRQILPMHNEIVREIYLAQHQSQELVSQLTALTEISPEELVDSNFNVLKKYLNQINKK